MIIDEGVQTPNFDVLQHRAIRQLVLASFPQSPAYSLQGQAFKRESILRKPD